MVRFVTAPTPADAREAVAAFAGRIADLHAQTEAANGALANARGEAASPDGLATVTVDASGAVVDVRFGPLAGVDPEQLRGAVLTAAAAARRAVLTAARDGVAAAVGADSPAVAELERRLVLAEAPAEPAGPAAAPVAEDDDVPDRPYDRRAR
jgi:DNA-binding protein YbaB